MLKESKAMDNDSTFAVGHYCSWLAEVRLRVGEELGTSAVAMAARRASERIEATADSTVVLLLETIGAATAAVPTSRLAAACRSLSIDSHAPPAPAYSAELGSGR